MRASATSPAEGSRRTTSSTWCAGAHTRKCVPSAFGSAPIRARRPATVGAGCGGRSAADSVRKDRSVVLDEEPMVVALVGIGGVVRAVGAPVLDLLLGIDRSDGADVGLVAGGARGALVGVHVHTGPILHVDTGLGDDGDTRHDSPIPVIGEA